MKLAINQIKAFDIFFILMYTFLFNDSISFMINNCFSGKSNSLKLSIIVKSTITELSLIFLNTAS